MPKEKKLTKTKLKKFKQLFIDRQQEIINSKNTEALQVEGGDEVDIIQANIINAIAERLSFRDKETLLKISEALLRINDGSFGKCAECENIIPEKRLLAIPYCRLCVSCAEDEENGFKR